MNPHLPVVTGKDLIRALRKNGWEITHVRGSHHQLMHTESGKRITVAAHAGAELKRGLLSSLLKEIGLSPDELRSIL